MVVLIFVKSEASIKSPIAALFAAIHQALYVPKYVSDLNSLTFVFKLLSAVAYIVVFYDGTDKDVIEPP